ncbi:hypothetical protein E2C01_031762 [Portunus trituberculatus]|uniref:Uncharacterized protein n=1 Tax=Portunus trituberculatus TaxID=210409 RepID=A0A5B7EYP7_PORTR|nr:hypothetical protein [Portunus trituberculatus]
MMFRGPRRLITSCPERGDTLHPTPSFPPCQRRVAPGHHLALTARHCLTRRPKSDYLKETHNCKLFSRLGSARNERRRPPAT